MAKNRGYMRNNKQNMAKGKPVIKVKQGKYDLSIGLIVKNEEKHLEKCLKALSALKEYISCEIIVTDTGSTDNTIEIAKKYADKLLHFEWCDDFAAARNTGINISEGSWFMSIDADEIGDDSIVEIANFMKREDRDKHNCAYITIYNYKNETEIADTLKASRLYNMTRGKRYFMGSIHEYIPVTVDRFDIRSYFHHYGYVQELTRVKSERNKKYLQKLLDENPEDIDALKYMMEAEIDMERKIEMCLETLDLIERKNIEDDYIHSFYLVALRCYINLKRLDDFLEFAQKYLDYLGDLEIYPRLEVLYLTASVWKELGNERYNCRYLKEYVKTYKTIQENKDYRYASIGAYSFTEQVTFVSSCLVASRYEGEYGDIEVARELIADSDAINYSSDGRTYPFITDLIESAIVIGDGDTVFEAYNKGSKLFDDRVNAFLSQTINKGFYKLLNRNDIKDGNSREENFLRTFTSNYGDDSFMVLNKLRLNNYDFSKLTTDEIELLKNNEKLFESDIYIDVVYAVIKNGVDPIGFYENTAKIEAENLIANIFKLRGNFEEMFEIIKSKNVSEIQVLRELSFYNYIAFCVLMKKVNVLESNNKKVYADDEISEIEKILEICVKGTNRYLNTVYKPELLNDMYMNILPPNEAFAFMVNKVIDKKDTEQVEYLAGLKKAVAYYPAVKPCVQLIAEKFKQIIESENKVIDQFQELGKQVKQMLRMIIRQGNKAQALEILEQYKGINPTDVDIETLEQEIEMYTK